MADLTRLETALRNADAAGDTEAAKTLAGAILEMRGSSTGPSSMVTPSPAPTPFRDQARANVATGSVPMMRGPVEDRTGWPEGMTQQDVDAAGDGTGMLRAFNLYDETRGVGAALTGGSYSEGKARAQAAQAEWEKQNPVYSKASEAGNAMLVAPGKIAATTMGRIGQAAIAGGALGTAAGVGDAEGKTWGESLADAGFKGAAGLGAGAIVGGLIGAGGEFAGRAIGSIWRGVADRTPRRAAADLGISDDAARAAEATFIADDPAQAIQNIRRAGPDAMPVDAGQASQGLLDTALQVPGPAQNTARKAVETRASAANMALDSRLNKTLGMPRGLKEMGGEIADQTAPARKAAYDAAFAKPIDYASAQGRKIERAMARIPPRILKDAIRKANEEMIADDMVNQQIMATISDSGKVTYREMPNVLQLDRVKQALNELGSEVDKFGHPTSDARLPRRLARELRAALGDAVPEYNKATALGADKIERQRALETGYELFSQKTRREDVANLVSGASDAEMEALRQGARSGIEERLSQVTRTITDADVPAREAQAALKILGSRANREKLGLILQDDKAAELLATEIDRAAMALELKAAIAQNSKTAVRQATQEAVREITEPGVIGAATRGRPLNTTQRAVQAAMQTRPSDDAARMSAVYDDLARVLVEPRGAEAERVYRLLSDMVADKRLNRGKATKIARSLFQTGNRFIAPSSLEASERIGAKLFPKAGGGGGF